MFSKMHLGKGRFSDNYLIGSKSFYHDTKRISDHWSFSLKELRDLFVYSKLSTVHFGKILKHSPKYDELRSCLSALNVIVLDSLNIISFREAQPISFSKNVAE